MAGKGDLLARPRRVQLIVALALLAAFGSILCAASTSSNHLTLNGIGNGPVNPGPDGRGVTDGSVASSGHFALAGAFDDEGTYTDRRTVTGRVATIRKTLVSTTGTITIGITVHLGSDDPSPWTIISDTGDYAGLKGNGRLTVDDYQDNPYTFVLTGTVWR